MYKITSRFKEFESFRNKPHNGIDLKMKVGEPLRSIKSGVIHLRDYGDKNAGKTIIIETKEGRSFIYGHLSEFCVKEGQIVERGELIGYSGNTGFSTGAHLHFGVKYGDKFVDPSPYLNDIQNMSTLIVEKAIPEFKFSMTDFLSKGTEDVFTSLFKMLKVNFIYYYEHLLEFFLQ